MQLQVSGFTGFRAPAWGHYEIQGFTRFKSGTRAWDLGFLADRV